ncbi:hypothetical protein [Jatrophihabitans endophyticus]|uniref:hypothetical protein n=1 Tax=Jatrophihabitans endophyticus TaxID=1206085 RepID=UPI000934BC7C|nr:hypothetical protein [Jatrophihabitans endophyticus]
MRLLQEDVPSTSLEQALRVARAIGENYAYKPTRPLNVAQAMSMSPTSGPFRMITGAAVAYGLTTAAAQAPEIGLTPIGMRIVRPTTEGDDLAARREALLRPKIVGDFLRQYDGAAIPTDVIAKNVLQERGVPAERTESVLELIVAGASEVGFVREWNGKRYVDLAGQAVDAPRDGVSPGGNPPTSPATTQTNQPSMMQPPPVTISPPAPAAGVSLSSGVHINIEIHIAADATSETVEDIFRNMRRYVLSADEVADDDTTSAG